MSESAHLLPFSFYFHSESKWRLVYLLEMWTCEAVRTRAGEGRVWHGALTFTQPLLNQQEWRHADLLLQVSDDWKNGSFYSNSQFAVLYLEHRICNITDPLMSEYHSLT